MKIIRRIFFYFIHIQDIHGILIILMQYKQKHTNTIQHKLGHNIHENIYLWLFKSYSELNASESVQWGFILKNSIDSISNHE